MADKRIKDLDEKTLLADADALAINDDSTNFDKKVTSRTIIDYTANFYRGFNGVSLTNFDNTSEPQLAGGSTVEIEQSLHQITGSISITGLAGIANDNNVYIYVTASGNAFTASGSTTSPTWDTGKHGFYSGTDRAVAGLYKDGSGNYTLKYIYHNISDGTVIKKYGNGDIGIINSVEGDLNIGGSLNCYQVTQSKHQILTVSRSSIGSSSSASITIKKPVIVLINSTTVSSAYNCYLQLNQDGGWRNINVGVVTSSTQDAYAISVLPGEYRLYLTLSASGSSTSATAYITDVYGSTDITSSNVYT